MNKYVIEKCMLLSYNVQLINYLECVEYSNGGNYFSLQQVV